MLGRLAATAIGLLISLAAATASAEVVVVVSSESPVRTLSRTVLTDIYLGRLNRFPNGEPAVPIDQTERSPAHDEFYREYLGRSSAQMRAYWSKLIFTGRGQPPRAASGDAAAADIVASSPNAIGYVDSSAVDERLRVVNID